MTFKHSKERNIADGSISNPYRSKSKNNHMTNAHFKKLTEMEKKQIEMLGKIHRMKNKGRILDDIKFITNKILSNCAYHEKNIEEQFKKLEKVNIPEHEKKIIIDAWDLKFKLGTSLLKDLEELIIYVKNNS